MNKPFRNRIQELREQLKMTQEQLAQVVNVGKSSVSMWESGKRRPKSEILETLCDFFNVDMDY